MAISIRKTDLIYPYFVIGGRDKKEAIKSFPGQFRFSSDRLIRDVEGLYRSGIDKILLFGVPRNKDEMGSSAYAKDNIVSSAVKELKKHFPDIIIFTDVCLCAYTTHGHCGILKSLVTIDNKGTLKALSKMALSHAEAGADYVAPSAMAKGQVLVIRKALNNNGFKKTKIMGYSAKFASSFYGPFRNAASSSPKFGDRSSYQLDYKNAEKALIEIADDIKEGADIVMVKPALAYLDIIYRAKERFKTKIAAYNVSGEYAMLKNYIRTTKLEKSIVFEALSSIKRAGADLIITYHAKDVGRWLKNI